MTSGLSGRGRYYRHAVKRGFVWRDKLIRPEEVIAKSAVAEASSD